MRSNRTSNSLRIRVMGWFSRKKSDAERISELIKKDSPAIDELFSSIASRDEANQLYRSLSIRLHPDQYIPLGDEPKIKRATELFAKVQSNRTDLKVLKEIEVIVNSEF